MTTLVRTRHVYDSYRDFWRLVEASELDTCYVDEVNAADDSKTYIFTPINGEVSPSHLDAWKSRRAKIVWWNLERPEDETLASSIDKVADSLDAIWVSDRTFAALDSRFTYVPIAGHRKFGTTSWTRNYDICHLAYLWGRRKNTIDGLAMQGLRIAPEAWGREQQDKVVATSRLMLNLHQYEGMFVAAPLRFAVAASYAIPVVSESFSDKHARAHVLLMGTIPQLLGRGDKSIHAILSHDNRLLSAGEALYQNMCIHTDFGLEVERAARKVATGKTG